MVEAVAIVRSLHILFAILWAGGGIHYARVTWPALRATSMQGSFVAASRHGPFMGLTSLGTVSFGLAVFFMVGPANYSSTESAILGVGMLAGIIGAVNGFAGHLPAEIKLKAAMADGADLGPFLAREDLLGRISMAAIGIALLAMITFRWF